MATETQHQRRPARRANRSSLLFLALAVVLVAIALVLLRRDKEKSAQPILPTAPAGQNQLAHVIQALREQGLKVDVPHTLGIPIGVLNAVGQPLTVDGSTLYVFIYREGTAARERDAQNLDPTALLASDGTPTPATVAPPRIFQHSNVLVALVGGSSDLATKVNQAISGLR